MKNITLRYRVRLNIKLKRGIWNLSLWRSEKWTLRVPFTRRVGVADGDSFGKNQYCLLSFGKAGEISSRETTFLWFHCDCNSPVAHVAKEVCLKSFCSLRGGWSTKINLAGTAVHRKPGHRCPIHFSTPVIALSGVCVGGPNRLYSPTILGD